MIQIKPDEEALRKISDKIGNIPYKAPTILKDAANETGKMAMQRVQQGIRQRYVYKDSAVRLKEHIKRKSATYQNPRTIIEARGTMNSMSDFVVTPRRLSRGANRAGPYAVHVLRSTSPVRMNERTFMVQFKSGHIAVVQRIPGKKYSDKYALEREAKHLDVTKIKELKGPSIAHMASGVYHEVEGEIGIRLQANIQKHIDRFMKRGTG